jgi:septal ring factor EnvC (AmiA/AmiB activator)
MKKLIKKYWKYCILVVLGIFGIFRIMSKSIKHRSVERKRKTIRENELEISKLQGKKDITEQQKSELEKKIHKEKETLETLKNELANGYISNSNEKTDDDVKNNILKHIGK